MNGTISVDSEIDKGSVFTFKVPAKKGMDTMTLKRPVKFNTNSFKRVRVLYVDDDCINIQIGKEMLKGLGCVVDTAENGKEAIYKINNNKYDIVLMDIQMPDLDGLGAIKIIRDDDKFTDLKVIAYSANTGKEDIEKYYKAGFDGFVPKPCDRSDFISEMGRLLGFDTGVKNTNESTIEISSGIDKQALIDDYGDENLVSDFIRDFKEKHKDTIFKIEEFLDNFEKEEALSLVHKFKGVSGMIKARRLHKLVKELEILIKKEEENIKEKIEEIKKEWEKL